MTGLSIAPTPMQEASRTTLQRVVVSGGGNRAAAASPSLPGVEPPRSVAGMVAAAASTLAAIPVLMVEVVSEVTLMAPPPPAVAEEERETELPASSIGELHGSPLRLEPKALEGDMAWTELELSMAACAPKVVDIPSDDKAELVAEPPMSSQELVVVRSKSGPSGGLLEDDLEWPCPKDPTKLEDVQERVKSTQQLVEVDLQLAMESLKGMSSHKSCFLRMEHAQMAELEHQLDSDHQAQRATERATTAERGLEAETEVELRTSLTDTEVALQKSLKTLELERSALASERNALELARKAVESEQKALEPERKARSEVDREVLVLWGRVMGMEEPISELVTLLSEQGGRVKTLERDLETIKMTFSQNAEELAKSHEERRALEGELD
ncbi:uncharacterized protein [Miscanthus floridulus]|uniref:uncharacterized protein n=1 Tax=Miscanthus floridulus TaxID=154761 RepID=UPI0034578DA3